MADLMTLPTATYSAYRGYAWSNVPEGISVERLNAFCRAASAARGDFPDPLSIEVGVIADETIAAAFTLQNVDQWDAEGRASDYFAFAFFPIVLAPKIDFVALQNTDFFWMPSREPLKALSYGGGDATEYPKELQIELEIAQKTTLADPHAIGTLLADLAPRYRQLTCRLVDGQKFEISCEQR